MGIIRVMPGWAVASLPFFIYTAIMAVALRGLSARARTRVFASAAVGLVVAAWGAWTDTGWVRAVAAPPLVLLIAYWGSGFLWVAPMRRCEALLMQADALLRVHRIAARMPRVLAELLEIAYVGVYPLIPVSLALHLWYAPRADADRFWTVILVTDFVCFAMLPWIETRPPRALEPEAPWRSRVRAFNVRLLGETSIGVNTVPSGHAAEAVACALLLCGTPAAVQAPVWLAALAVSAGAVLGRYHFAIDAIAGWAVALVVWLAIGG